MLIQLTRLELNLEEKAFNPSPVFINIYNISYFSPYTSEYSGAPVTSMDLKHSMLILAESPLEIADKINEAILGQAKSSALAATRALEALEERE